MRPPPASHSRSSASRKRAGCTRSISSRVASRGSIGVTSVGDACPLARLRARRRGVRGRSGWPAPVAWSRNLGCVANRIATRARVPLSRVKDARGHLGASGVLVEQRRPLACGSPRGRTTSSPTTAAQLAPVPGAPLPTVARIRAIARQLADDGYEQAITVALSPTEQEPFRDAGFVLQERLHLLVHHLAAVPPRTTPKPRRARRDDWPAIEQTDAESFSEFWRLGQQGLRQAMAATPVRRMRVIGVDEADQVIAYALTGRAGPTGYLQRLAVRPAHQGEGLGRCLAIDCLHWLRRHRADPRPRQHAGHQRAGVQPLPEPGLQSSTRAAWRCCACR